MGQISSNIYSKTAMYDFSIDGALIATPFKNLGITLNPGEFIISVYYKVVRPFASPVPATDSYGFEFTGSVGPTIGILGTTNSFNANVGVWRTGIFTTGANITVNQNANPQGVSSNVYLFGALFAGNPNTAGAIAIFANIGSTNI